MTEFGFFLLDHWLLSSLFVIILGILIINEFLHRHRGIKHLTPQEVIHLINHSRGVLIDLRSQEAFMTAHILGAINIANENLDRQINQLKKYQSREIILVCPNGLTAPKSAAWLKARNFKQVSCLRGGLDSWKTGNLPLIATRKKAK